MLKYYKLVSKSKESTSAPPIQQESEPLDDEVDINPNPQVPKLPPIQQESEPLDDEVDVNPNPQVPKLPNDVSEKWAYLELDPGKRKPILDYHPNERDEWVLSPKYFNFPFPITLTMTHMGFSGLVAFFLVRVCKVVPPVKMTFQIYATCVIPISAFFASSLWFGNTAYLYISVAFIQMLKALMPVATFVMAVICGTDKLRCDLFLNMLLVSVGVVISSYGEIHFNTIGTVYQVTGIFAEALRLVLTQVLLQKKGLQLNPVTSLYYIAPCSFLFLFVPWYLLEKPGMEVSQIQFNFWIFFSNALCALALNFSIFLVIGRTGAVTIRVAGVLKDWILIALSTVIFPESAITGLNVIGYAVALCGVVMYNYLKVKDVGASNQVPESLPDRATKDWKVDKKSSDIFVPDNSSNKNISAGNSPVSSSLDSAVDEEAPLLAVSRLSYIGRSKTNQ